MALLAVHLLLARQFSVILIDGLSSMLLKVFAAPSWPQFFHELGPTEKCQSIRRVWNLEFASLKVYVKIIRQTIQILWISGLVSMKPLLCLYVWCR